LFIRLVVARLLFGLPVGFRPESTPQEKATLSESISDRNVPARPTADEVLWLLGDRTAASFPMMMMMLMCSADRQIQAWAAAVKPGRGT
jgi:hypothetical protein